MEIRLWMRREGFRQRKEINVFLDGNSDWSEMGTWSCGVFSEAVHPRSHPDATHKLKQGRKYMTGHDLESWHRGSGGGDLDGQTDREASNWIRIGCSHLIF